MRRDLFDPGLGGAAAPPADERSAVRIDRAQFELRHGRLVALTEAGPAGEVLLAAAIDSLDRAAAPALLRWSAQWRVVLTAERLWALGLTAATAARSFGTAAGFTPARLETLAAALAARHPEGEAQGETLAQAARSSPPGSPLLAHAGLDAGDARAASPAMQAALALAKRARLAPALLVCELPSGSRSALQQEEVLCLRASEALPALAAQGRRLRQVGAASVPLAGHADCRVLLYREAEGEAEHVAVVVGRPDRGRPVDVRLHSACLTGDLLGSLRCDCGEQLRGAVAQLAEGGGVLLYLAQEGRGIGLANKLRAYRLQDGGLDTFEADRHLGFAADQRDFGPAAAMLEHLGIARVRLLSNNPRKIDALRRAGIEVAERLPLTVPRNPHNARYIEAKQAQAGHFA